jgi:transposase
MSMFLTMVSERHESEFVIMVMDQAGWHIAAGLEVPPNMRLVFLPPYSPEINPAEHIWDTSSVRLKSEQIQLVRAD